MRKRSSNYIKFIKRMDRKTKDQLREELKERIKKSKKERDIRMYERYLTIQLILRKTSAKEIAKIIGRSVRTVYEYINSFLENGLEGLTRGQSKGRASYLTPEQKEIVVELIVNKTPEEVGFPAEMNWTSVLLREWIKREWGIEYSSSGVKELMYSLNLSYTRPTYTLKKADLLKQEEFKKKFSLLIDNLHDDKIQHILFEDEAMIRDYQAIAKTWFLKGQQKIIPTYGKHQGVKLLGTLHYETGEVFVMENKSYNAEVFLCFLKSVLKKYPVGKIALILDNAKIHHAKLIQPFLKEHKDRLELHFLPPYSPNLNCIEKFWGWLKKSCIHNVFFSSVDEIRNAVQSFVSKVNESPDKTIDRICLFSY